MHSVHWCWPRKPRWCRQYPAQHQLLHDWLKRNGALRVVVDVAAPGALDSDLTIQGMQPTGSDASSAGLGISRSLPVVSGGQALRGWTERTVRGMRLWVRGTNVSTAFSKLYLGRRELLRSRVPADPRHFLQWESPLAPCAGSKCPPVDATGFVFRAGDLSPAWNLSGAHVLTFGSWEAQWRDVRSVDFVNRTLRVTRPLLYTVSSKAANTPQLGS